VQSGGFQQCVAGWLLRGAERTLFDGAAEKLALKLTKTRAFGNWNVLLCYEPMM